jgi:hypothetical protein
VRVIHVKRTLTIHLLDTITTLDDSLTQRIGVYSDLSQLIHPWLLDDLLNFQRHLFDINHNQNLHISISKNEILRLMVNQFPHIIKSPATYTKKRYANKTKKKKKRGKHHLRKKNSNKKGTNRKQTQANAWSF